MPGLKLATPFVDAHQHFWDLHANPYPWLQGEEVKGFRYGDYSALKRDYLPPTTHATRRAFAPVKTVHVEAEWARANPVDETAWLTALAARTGRPSAWSRMPGWTARTWPRSLPRKARTRWCAAFARSR
jgi:predicted TIM-barrel fold metal-dependent hydrolase